MMDDTPGEGEPGKDGKQGRPGTSSPYARRNALILYGFTAILFLALIIRGNIRDDHISELQRDNHRLTVQIGALQQKTSSQVLCPLYGLLVDQIDHLTPEQKAKPRIAAQITVIEKGYKALDCKTVTPQEKP